MVGVVAVVLALVFGGADQYIGSISAWLPWSADVSLLSAPWLVLPFLAGWTQREPTRGAVLGFVCTYAALLGYAVMTLSPVENAHVTLRAVEGFVQSEHRVLIGGLVTGPLFGWFGERWRTRRAWAGALATAVALCLEPLVREHTVNAIRSHAVALAEVAVGLALALYVAWARLRQPTA